MEKLKLHTPNFVDEHIAKIAELLPNCITEKEETTTDAKGCEMKIAKKVIDWDLLKQELSDHIVEGQQERYRLDWPGKREALLTANTPIAKTLRPCREESVDFEATENLFIEGDNLDALKLLQETYLGKIKMIYIDPPYNTGKDFIYKDNFVMDSEEWKIESDDYDEEGNRLVANTDSNGRFHSDWLSMIYPRLKLARNLLKDDGVIFISIDDNEVHNLRKICDEIFGTENFITTVAVKLSEATGVKMTHARQRIPKLKEYILVYRKSSTPDIEPSMVDKEKWDSEYKTVCTNISKAELDLIKNIMVNERRSCAEIAMVEELLAKIEFKNAQAVCKYETEENLNNEWCFYNAFRIVQLVSITGGAQNLAKDKKKSFGNSNIPNAFCIVTPNKKMYAIKTDFNENSNIPRCKLLFADQYLQVNTGDFWNDIKTTGLDNEGFVDFKNGKKPLKMIKRCLKLISSPNDIILDFFAGSATTAHAVMQLNAEDGGKRKFIMVQLPEVCDEKSEAFKAGYKTIAEISKERIRRAGKKIGDNLQLKIDNGQLVAKDKKHSQLSTLNSPLSIDIGFRVLKVDSSNMVDVYYTSDEADQGTIDKFIDNIKSDRTPEDLLFQVLLDWGVDLTLPITKETIEGREVFFVDENALAACFNQEGQITKEFCKVLAKRQSLRVVFRDSGFKDDSVKINVEQIFKLLSPGTEVKTI